MADEFLDPAGNPSDAVQVGQGAADEYEAAGKASGDGQESVKDIKARVGDMSDEELAELAESDERKGVQDAVAAEQAKRSEDAGSGDDS